MSANRSTFLFTPLFHWLSFHFIRLLIGFLFCSLIFTIVQQVIHIFNREMKSLPLIARFVCLVTDCLYVHQSLYDLSIE